MLPPFSVALMRSAWYAWLLSGSSHSGWTTKPALTAPCAHLMAARVSLELMATVLPSLLTSLAPYDHSTGFHIVSESPYACPSVCVIGGKPAALSLPAAVVNSSHVFGNGEIPAFRKLPVR